MHIERVCVDMLVSGLSCVPASVYVYPSTVGSMHVYTVYTYTCMHIRT